MPALYKSPRVQNHVRLRDMKNLYLCSPQSRSTLNDLPVLGAQNIHFGHDPASSIRPAAVATPAIPLCRERVLCSHAKPKAYKNPDFLSMALQDTPASNCGHEAKRS